jgi:hypothetical protein
MTIKTDSTIIAVKDQVSSVLGEEAVILSLDNSVYYGLDPVGARIWTLLKGERTVKELIEILLGEYEVEPERLEPDLLRLLGELQREGLIEVRG